MDEHLTTYENPFKFSGKELDDVTGLYDHGARSRNPISTLWYGVDPLFEKYPDFSPYNYCAGNPVKMVDPDGRRKFNIIDEESETKSIDDGVDEMVEIYKEDFSLLKEIFDSNTPNSKEKYISYFKAFTTRPSFKEMEANYPSIELSVDEVYKSIGGKVAYNRDNFPDSFTNTCAIRMSKSLNYSGCRVQNIKGIEVGSGEDKLWYIYKVEMLDKFLNKTFGSPEFSGTYDELQKSGLKGIIKFSDCGWSDATGHFDLYNENCVNHCYGDRCGKVELWVLPH